MKYVFDYEIKFVNNKPYIISYYSNNTYSMDELSNSLYISIINEINKNIKLIDKEFINNNIKSNKLLKASLVCLTISTSSPFVFMNTNNNSFIFLSMNAIGFLYYFYNAYKYDSVTNYLKYDLYFNNEELINTINNDFINNLDVNSLKLLSKRINLIKRINSFNSDIKLPLIDISIISKMNVKDVERLINNKKLVKNK